MQYQIPENIDPQKVFLVRKSELLDRFDAQYYKEHFDFSNFTRLSHYVTIQGGKRIPKGEGYSFDTTPYLYLRVADITEESAVGYSKLKCIDEKIFKILEKYEIHENEIAISIAGTIGKVLLVKNVPTDKRIILTENCAKLIVRGDRLIPEYLSIVLRISILQKQMMLNYIQTTIPKIGLDRIGKLMIPNIPSRAKQEEIIAYYNEAVEEQKAKNKESQQLLDSINDYLLEELGITLPNIEMGLDNRIIIIPFSQLQGRRMDPLFMLSWGKNAVSSKYDSISLGKIADISKGNALTSKDAIPGPIPVIAGGQTSPYSHNVANFQGNVITVSASGAYSGYVWYHREPIFATDCSVVKSKDEDDYLTEYIFEVLKLQQKSIYWLQTGAAQPHVYASDLKDLVIPDIPLSQQRAIVEHVREMRQRANSLCEEGKQILQQANREVEQMILG